MNIKLEKCICPLTNRKYFSLSVTDMKLNLAEMLIVSHESTITDLVGGLRKLADRLDVPHD